MSNRRQKRSSMRDVIIPLAGLVLCMPFLFACLNPNQEQRGVGCGNAAVITANTRHIMSWRCCRQLRHSINVFFSSHTTGPTHYCWTRSIFFITATLFCLCTTCKLINFYYTVKSSIVLGLYRCVSVRSSNTWLTVTSVALRAMSNHGGF